MVPDDDIVGRADDADANNLRADDADADGDAEDADTDVNADAAHSNRGSDDACADDNRPDHARAVAITNDERADVPI